MVTLVVHNVEEEVHLRLKEQALAHGRSMKEEVRVLIRQGLEEVPPERMKFGEAMGALFAPLGGLEVAEIRREPP